MVLGSRHLATPGDKEACFGTVRYTTGSTVWMSPQQRPKLHHVGATLKKLSLSPLAPVAGARLDDAATLLASTAALALASRVIDVNTRVTLA